MTETEKKHRKVDLKVQTSLPAGDSLCRSAAGFVAMVGRAQGAASPPGPLPARQTATSTPNASFPASRSSSSLKLAKPNRQPGPVHGTSSQGATPGGARSVSGLPPPRKAAVMSTTLAQRQKAYLEAAAASGGGGSSSRAKSPEGPGPRPPPPRFRAKPGGASKTNVPSLQSNRSEREGSAQLVNSRPEDVRSKEKRNSTGGTTNVVMSASKTSTGELAISTSKNGAGANIKSSQESSSPYDEPVIVQWDEDDAKKFPESTWLDKQSRKKTISRPTSVAVANGVPSVDVSAAAPADDTSTVSRFGGASVDAI